MFLVLIILGLCSTSSYSYGQCPYDPEDAVPDTLDPLGYYPLEVGNVWEFEMYDGAFPGDLRREQILSYDSTGDTIFFRVRVTRFHRVGTNTFNKRPPTESARGIVLGDEVWLGGMTPDGWQNALRFDVPFFTCFFSSDTQDSVAVGGESNYRVSIEDDELLVSARKDFNRQFWGEEYGHGLGPVGGWGDPDVRTSLIYARIGDEEYGVPIEKRDITIVSARDGHESPENTDLRADIFPNPFGTKLRIILYAARPEGIAVEIFDLVGRRIAMPVQHRQLQPGTYAIDWDAEGLAPGVYLLRITTGDSEAISRVVLKK